MEFNTPRKEVFVLDSEALEEVVAGTCIKDQNMERSCACISESPTSASGTLISTEEGTGTSNG